MVNLTINSIPVTVPEGTTILDAAASVDIEIPSLCYLKELNEISACRVCCVEVEGEGKLVPSCNNVVREGMVIRTNSPRALEARRVNMELILSQHDNKCATCIRSGTCQLQKIANDMGILGVSYPTDLARGKKADWTTTFPLYRDVNKCIKCMRCIQVCDKVQSLSVWDISGSGARTTIDVSGNRVIKQADCSLCGQCITHCPTGALRERDDTQKAYAALGDPDRVTIVQIAPAVRAAWGEAFGMPTGKATVGQLVSVLRKLGADYVFDTTFSADLTIMEEGRAAPASSGGRSGQPADVYLVLPGLGALFEVAVPGNDRPSVHRQVAAADVRRGRQDLAGTQPRRGCGQNLQHLHHAVHRKKGRARVAEHGFGRSRQRCRSGHHHPRAGAHGACRAPRCGKHRGIRV